MIKIQSSRAFGLSVFLAVLCLTVHTTLAGTLGVLTYEPSLDGLSVTITDCDTTATGPLVIPDTINDKPVTAIGASAFAGCNGLTSVTIPSSVTSIGDSAFFNCSGLTSAPLPSVVTSIGTLAFGYCNSLTSMTVPVGVPVIANNLFEGCSSLVSLTLPSAATSIGTNSFRSCVSLTGLTLPSSLGSIGSGAFSNCTQLAGISLPPTLTIMGDKAFALCIALTSVTIPSSLAVIPTSAFEDCSSLTGLTLSNGVTTLQSSAFRRCTALTAVTIPASVTSIATDSFSRCYALASITVDPANLNYSSLGGVMFNKDQKTLWTCPAGLAGVYSVPSGVTIIEASAFRFSAALTSVTIPSSVTLIKSDNFGSCSVLTSINVDASNNAYSSVGGVLFYKDQKFLLAYPSGLGGTYTIPTGVTTIGSAAFRSSNALTAVTIPAGVATINSDAFATCSQLVSATFMGNSPSMGQRVFQAAAANFKVYFQTGVSGFTTPTWQGYPSMQLSAISPWLSSYGLPMDADIKSDSNGDGVSLLMAYALNLNPNQNLSTSMPQPVFSTNQMSLSFFAGSIGVTYSVEASADLKNWSAVTLPTPDSNQVRTATVDRSGPLRFMRLAVRY